MHFSVRLNRENPKHGKILKFLDEMDLKKYKSKISFLVEAMLFYIECIEDGSLENVKDRNFRKFSKDFVTRDEFNEKFNSLSDVLEKKIYKEILSSYLRHTAAPSLEENVENKAESSLDGCAIEESLAENLSRYQGVMDSVMSWSDDG